MQRRGLGMPLLGLALISGSATGAVAAEPKVVVSIAPLAGIAAAVMGDAAKPTVLLPPNQSPHHGALKPSQARALAEADLVLWIGPDLEAALDTALDAMPDAWVAQHAVSALVLKDVARKPFRHLETLEIEVHGKDEHKHDEKDEHKHAGEKDAHEAHDHDHHGDVDPHVWLDPANATAIARALAERLALLAPERAQVYRDNADRFAGAMTALKSELAAQLEGVRGRPFVVFHDAYQYFETRFGLNAVAALTLDPSQPIAGRHLIGVRDRVRAVGATCVFADAQASHDAVKGIARDLGLKAGELDPLGVGIAADANAYPALLRRLAESYRACLGS